MFLFPKKSNKFARNNYHTRTIMKQKNLTKKLMIALLGAVLFVGCSKNESENVQEQDASKITARSAEQQSIETTIANFYDCLKKLKYSGFSDFLYDNFFLTSATTNNKTWYEFLDGKFKEQYVGQKEGFVYEKLLGTYTWDSSAKKWGKTANSNNVTLHFPAFNTTASNNATLVLENYTSLNIGTNSLPTKGKATITVDNKKIIEVDIQGISYGLIPTLIENAEVVIYGNPFTTTISLKKNGSVYNFTSNTSAPDGCTTTVNGVINLTNNSTISTDKVDFKALAFDNFKDLEFKVNFENLEIKVNADIAGLKALNKDVYSVEDMNNFVKVDVLSSGKKVADLKYNEDSNGKYDPDVVFLDGTTNKAESYFSYFSKKVKHVFRVVFGLEK
ncbi:hypothetical protein CAPN002_17250 [Capnocytophaga stomatis]|nr:hypothetical protein CAPN002_17250 [Capnocytophaga stomatis]